MRLIDADALKKEVDNFQNCYNGWSDTYDKAYIIEAIEEAPTIDIVRCGECKYTDGNPPIADGRSWCVLHGSFMYYCSDGERSE